MSFGTPVLSVRGSAPDGAMRFVGHFLKLVRQIAEYGSHAFIYYSSVLFGQVAATVNYGRPMSDPEKVSRVNGIQARNQAYTSALVVLSEGFSFPDVHGNTLDLPSGHMPRRV